MVDPNNPESDDTRTGASSDETQESTITQQTPYIRKMLRQISRSRTRLLVCMLTLPVYMVAVWLLLKNQRGIDTFMFLYMAMWAAFAVDMARRRCPLCGKQYFVKSVFLNLISKRCVHCKLVPAQATVIGDSEEDIDHRQF